MTTPRPLPLTLDDFALLHEAGAFEGHSKVELIDGVLYTMNPQRTRHAYAKTELAFRLYVALKAVGSDLFPLVEGTVAMPPSSAPEPDIAIGRIQPGSADYVSLSSVALIVEISDSSLRYDLGPKKRLYAREGIAEYWVVDLGGRKVHQYWNASGADYSETLVHDLGQAIGSALIEGLHVSTNGLL